MDEAKLHLVCSEFSEAMAVSAENIANSIDESGLKITAADALRSFARALRTTAASHWRDGGPSIHDTMGNA